MGEGKSPNFANTESDSDSVDQIYDIDAMTSRMIGSITVTSIPSRNVSESKMKVQDVPQAKTFHLKGRHSTVSPEEMSERWQIGIKQSR